MKPNNKDRFAVPCPILPGRETIGIHGIDRAKVTPAPTKDATPLAWADLHRYFDAVYVISLARREDRRQAFRQQIRPSTWPFGDPQFVAGVDARTAILQGNAGAACHLSHLRVLHQALVENHRRILILEDDCELTEDFTSTVAKFLANVPDDWECLMLGGQLFDESQSVDCGNGVRRVSHVEMLHCYALQGGAIASLARYWEQTFPHCDHRIAEWQDAGHVTYAPAKWIAGQSAGRSDIVNVDMPKRMFDVRTDRKKLPLAAPHNTAVCTVACYPADVVDAKLALLRQSAEFYGVDLTVFGIGESHVSHFSAKVMRLRKWIDGLPESVKFLMFVDARDVLFNGGMIEICEAVNSSPDTVLVSTESACSPDARFAHGFTPSINQRTYLNTGVYSGSRESVVAMLDAWIERHAMNAGDPWRDNDQHLGHVAFADGHPMKLDTDGRLSASIYGLDTAPPPNQQFDIVKGRLTWRDNSVSPCVVHFNGMDVSRLPEWWAAMSK